MLMDPVPESISTEEVNECHDSPQTNDRLPPKKPQDDPFLQTKHVAQTVTHERDVPEETINRVDATQSTSLFKFRDWLRQYRLQHLSVWAKSECRKVAMYKSRPTALIHSFMHLIPLAGALTLLTLSWSKCWVGQTFEGTTGLQFAAKFLELFMQASIVDVILCVIRTLAIHRFVPLGALSGMTQATQLSYLWSTDYWATIRAWDFYGRDAVLFVYMVPFTFLLMTLVGPSAAVLMIPRPGSFHQNATVTHYVSASAFPTNVTSVQLMDYGLEFDTQTFTGINKLTGWTVHPEDTYPINSTYHNNDANRVSYGSLLYDTSLAPWIGSATTRRRMNIIDTEPGTWGDNSNFVDSLQFRRSPIHAAIPTRLSALSLCDTARDPICWQKSGEGMSLTNNSYTGWSVRMPQAVVKTTCRGPKLNMATYIRDDGVETQLFNSTQAFADRLVQGHSSKNATPNLTEINVEYSSPLWLHMPDSGSSSLIGVFTRPMIYPNTTNTPESLDCDTPVIVCTIQSYWTPAVAKLVYTDTERPIVETDLLKAQKTIEPEEINAITLNIADDSYLRTGSFHRDILLAKNDFAMVLACMFADAVSRIANTTISSHQTHDMPVPYVYTQILSGYGYGHMATSDILAMVVLTTYCAVTMAYIAYTLITGATSTAWSSPIELVMLALHSHKPEHLGHTSVGVDSMQTFCKNVGIRVNQQDEVELVFPLARNVEPKGLRKIERNKAY